MGIAFYIFVYIIAAPFLLLALPGYWKLFEKAGRRGWEALIPIYSDYVMLKISGRPAWWLIWLFIPLLNIIVGIGIYIDFIKSYGKFTTREQAAAVFFPFVYIPKWGFENKTHYLGQSSSAGFKAKHKGIRKSSLKDWTLAVTFPIIASIFIRAFVIEAYVMPTPSMERSLLVGDYFFVSKLSYGARMPVTPLAYPFANHTIPQTDSKAYSEAVKFPYYRFPGFCEVKKGDVVVFNYPQDTINNRPVDKRETYIKRCQGTPGDRLSLVDGQVYVNGKAMPNPAGEQMEYNIKTTGVDVNPQLYNDLHITIYEGHLYPAMTKESADVLKGYSNVKSIVPDISPKGASSYSTVFPSYFPMHVQLTSKLPDYKWSVDNFGPIVIPKKGWTVKLDSITFPLYERAIEIYENNKVQATSGNILINGKKTNSYTFKMNYYWVMGDNRHDSEDSRFWGFLPEDHIIGKAWFIGISWDEYAPLFNKIRWNRLFKGID